ncbi:MAG TPA: Vms1/Ankzf1 family peptidyl-tRNA hydrolase, partial [Acidimicrobiales bacterium]|nr:Vms1/Ankzf1 family peptidyl-tRNA hydrolase [Acidimicrobiales bacterium]
MEAAGTVPRVGLSLEDLTGVLEQPGPFLTVYLRTDPHVENAAQRSELRWKSLRSELVDAGAPEEALAVVDDLVPEAHQLGETLATVVVDGRVAVVEHLDAVIEPDRGSWARLPDLLPLLRWRQDHPRFVVVLADRGGADVLVHRGAGVEPARDEVGDGDPERKVKPGGWSQARYQQRAEDDWLHTAKEVAEEVTRAVRQVDPRIVVLGGDVRARELILDQLPSEGRDRVHQIEPGRATDGSEAERDEEVRRLVATAVAEDTVALLDKYREELGQHDRAAEGAAATIDALNRGAVDVLLLGETDDERSAWVGPSAVPLGLRREDAAVGADEEPQEARL